MKRKWGQQVQYAKREIAPAAGSSWWATPEAQRDPVAFSQAWTREVPRIIQSNTWTPNGSRTLDTYYTGVK